MRSLARAGGLGPPLLLILASAVFGQGTGNSRDLVLGSQVQSGTETEAAKIVGWNDVLTVSLRTPLGTLAGAPVLIAADLRLRTDDAGALDLPGEPGACGVGPGLFFLVEGTGTATAVFPGLASLGASGHLCTLPIPDLSPLGPISIWIQGATFDAGAPNGIALTKTIRHDTDLLSTASTLTATEYGPGTSMGYGVAAADVNQDGSDDVLVGLPNADPGGVSNAGEVRIWFGPGQTLTQTLTAPAAQAGAAFGSVVRPGDLNGDGLIDLVVGARYEDVAGITDAGAAYVFFGPSFTSSVRVQAPVPEATARFGHMVAVTDWDGDGVGDVAVGAPRGSAGGYAQAGQVHVFRGPSMTLLASLGNPVPQSGSKFGYGLAGGDFDLDGAGDLAIGIPFHDVATADDTGMALIYRGGTTLPYATVAQPLDTGAVLGHAIVAADLNGDSFPDLAFGSEFDDDAGPVDAGSVHIAFGPAFTSTIEIVSPVPQAYGGFGSDVAVGDVNRDERPDLIVGAFYHTVSGLNHAGECVVLLGPVFEQWIELTAPDAAALAEAGRRVATGDVNGDGFDDVMLSAPFASPGGATNAQEGSVYLFR